MHAQTQKILWNWLASCVALDRSRLSLSEYTDHRSLKNEPLSFLV
jgi:hypothetical protein